MGQAPYLPNGGALGKGKSKRTRVEVDSSNFEIESSRNVTLHSDWFLNSYIVSAWECQLQCK